MSQLIIINFTYVIKKPVIFKTEYIVVCGNVILFQKLKNQPTMVEKMLF